VSALSWIATELALMSVVLTPMAAEFAAIPDPLLRRPRPSGPTIFVSAI